MDNKRRNILEIILNDVKNQIISFDQKAGILLPVIGIIYALLLDLIVLFDSDNFVASESPFKFWSYFSFFTMLFFGLISIICFVSVNFPRKRVKDGEKHPNYYYDIAKLDIKSFDESIMDFEKGCDVIEKQIIANSKICVVKHHLLRAGIYVLIPYALSIISLVIFIFLVLF